MKKFCFNLLTGIVLLFIAPWHGFAQEKVLEGKVTVYDSIPLVDVEVKVKSSGLVSLTDTLGHFRVECMNEDRLIFKARGFKRHRVKTTEDDTYLHVNMELGPGENSLELATRPEGHIRDAYKESVYTINDEKVDFSMYSNIYDALRGRVPGVSVRGNSVIIRGGNTFGGNLEPLFVVDGIIVSKFVFSSVPPSDIKSIKVLKGSEASIYGSRGGNGVIEVETKRGRFK